jgi:hypothetical protein
LLVFGGQGRGQCPDGGFDRRIFLEHVDQAP